MADLPHDATDASLRISSWDWEKILDFSVGLDSPARPDGSVFPWHSEEAPATFAGPRGTGRGLVPGRSLGRWTARRGARGYSAHPQEGSPADLRQFLGRASAVRLPRRGGSHQETCQSGSRLRGRHQSPQRLSPALRCVNSPVVTLDDLPQRYCQQCGKFHQLPDFDEGRRSCRRKLERHDKRKIRKAAAVIKDSMQIQTSRTESPLQNGDGETQTDNKSGQGFKKEFMEFSVRLFKQKYSQFLHEIPDSRLSCVGH